MNCLLFTILTCAAVGLPSAPAQEAPELDGNHSSPDATAGKDPAPPSPSPADEEADLPQAALRKTRPPEAYSGGRGTNFTDGKEAFAMMLANRSRATQRAFATGNSIFNDNWVTAPSSVGGRDGLGPLFNAVSCSSCHVKDGRGAPPEEGEIMVGLLLRLSIPGTDEHGGAKPEPVYGGQLGTKVLNVPSDLKPEADVPVKWIASSRTFPDGETISLRHPEFGPIKWNYGPPSADILIGPRLAQPVYGSGLLEAISESTIRALADPDDSNRDGISGRTNEVWDLTSNKTTLGRFGWKANQPSLRQQTAEAFVNDIGITSSLLPQEAVTPSQYPVLGILPTGNGPDGSPELTDLKFDRVVTYLQALGVPARRRLDDPVVRHGEKLFAQANCSACHVPEIQTSETAALPELRGQIIRPYTDLLIHDMGPELSDGRPDFLATGDEWRTQPLWGIGLNKAVNGHAFFLHDGRARTLQEAILWHGGESENSRIAFEKMSKAERSALLEFLESL